MLAKDVEFLKKAVIQFSFYKKGYEKEGTNYALVIRNNKKYIVKDVVCYQFSFTRTRKTNPVFVVESYGQLLINNGQAVIC